MIESRREKGLYWDKAWKLVEGCAKVSPGCDNCWSETETGVRAYHPNHNIRNRAQSVVDLGGSFDGSIIGRIDNLDLPLRTKKPTVWAIWNDLYHEDVPDAFRDQAYAVMALCPQHIFLVLTKRAKGMAAYFNSVFKEVQPGRDVDFLTSRWADQAVNIWGGSDPDSVWNDVAYHETPLPNVWHGVTAENQEQADARIPHLLRVPGKLFLSIEPMLGPIDLDDLVEGTLDSGGEHHYSCLECDVDPADDPWNGAVVQAVLLGGESGKHTRPMHPDWARAVRDQCAAAGVPYFHKQNGEWAPHEVVFDTDKVPNRAIPVGTFFAAQWRYGRENPSHDGSYPEYEPDVWRIGKRRAGRRLDGRTHDALPWDDDTQAAIPD